MTVSYEHQQVLKYFKNYSRFIKSEFDKALQQASLYASANGFDEDDLKLIADVGFKQKLVSRQLQKVIQTLIPKTYVPESVVQQVICWLLKNYNQNTSKVAIKCVLEWLTGLVEYELTNVAIINLYYDFYFWFLVLQSPQAAKLIYLLTKPSDVNRWYVKQLLKLYRHDESKVIGAVLYLFKTYKPRCVPESISAYSVQSIFGKVRSTLNNDFVKARERIKLLNAIPPHVDEVTWIQMRRLDKEKVNAVILVPKVNVLDNEFNIESAAHKSILNIKNVKELQEYILRSSASDHSRVMSLLNNFAGRHILAFSDIALQARFSFALYHSLYNAFLEHNPHVSLQEKEYLLECLAKFQIHIQQSVPVVSHWLTKYLTNWDGYDHAESIAQILQFINFSSYDELYDTVLYHLHTIFMAGTIDLKCYILRILGNLSVAIIFSHAIDKESENASTFFQVQTAWDFEEVVTNLYDFIRKLCIVGYYLGNGHILLDHCIAHLNDKILLAESNSNIQIWTMLPSLCYSGLFSLSPSLICRMCDMFRRYPESVSSVIITDYINCLYNATLKMEDDSYFLKLEKTISKKDKYFIQKVGGVTYLDIKHHFAFVCYNFNSEINKITSSWMDIGYRIKEVAIFLNYFLSKKKQKGGKKRKKKVQ